MVDDEFGDVAHKDKSFADQVMFWRKDKPRAGRRPPRADNAAPIDAAAEEDTDHQADRRQAGGDPARRPAKIKLPGL